MSKFNFLNKKNKSVPNNILLEYPIKGTNFDRNTPQGLNNYLILKAINSRYRKNLLGYSIITLLSMLSSSYGGYVTGLFLFILMAGTVEIVKLLLDRNQVGSVVLASIFSLTIAFIGLSKGFESVNNATTNVTKTEQSLKASIASITEQLKGLNTPAKQGQPQIQIRFDDTSYRRIINKISVASSELERLKKEHHTYWQKRPNRRHKRTGAWMLAHPGKCTGSYCPKLQAKADHVKSLNAQKLELERQRIKSQELQKLQLNAQRDEARIAHQREQTKQKLMAERAEQQKQLMNLYTKTKVGISTYITTPLLLLFLLFIEKYQHQSAFVLSQIGSHKNKINTMYKTYKNQVKEQNLIKKDNKKYNKTRTPTPLDSKIERNLSDGAKRVRRALIKAKQLDIVIIGRFQEVHIATLLENRGLRKDAEAAKGDASLEQGLIKLLQKWKVTSTRFRGHELTSNFKRSLQ